MFIPLFLIIISVLCFVIHLELQRSCKYFIVNGLSIKAYSLNKLLTYLLSQLL